MSGVSNITKPYVPSSDEYPINKPISIQSGLTAACLTSKHTTASVQEEIMKYIKKWIPSQRTAMLAGNSVHADRAFLAREMPKIVDWLHYRSLS